MTQLAIGWRDRVGVVPVDPCKCGHDISEHASPAGSCDWTTSGQRAHITVVCGCREFVASWCEVHGRAGEHHCCPSFDLCADCVVARESTAPE